MKKALIILIALLMIPSMVFAEGSKEAAVPEKSGIKVSPAGTYPIVDEPVTVKIMITQAPCIEDYNTNEFSEYLEDLTGVHVEYINVPEQVASEKLNLTLAGNDWPDAFLGFKFTSDLESLYGVDEQLLKPLNEYYNEEWMPNMMNAFTDYPGATGFMTNIDGNIYSLPKLEGCLHCSNMWKMWVNTDFMDALDLDIPTNTDEFYDCLVAIRDGDPNGNGKADEIPLAGAILGWGTSLESFLLNAFIYTDLDYDVAKPADVGIGYYLDNGTVKTMVNSDEYREGLRYLHKLYEEGLIYNGSFTQDDIQLTQLVEAGADPTVGFVTGGWRGCFSTVDKERFRAFKAISPIAGPEGVREARNLLQVPAPGALVINANSPYADVLIRWADYFFSDEGVLRTRWGEPGVGFRWAEEGETGLDEGPAIWKELIPWSDKDPQNRTWIHHQVGNMSYSIKDGMAVPLVSRDDPEYQSIGFNEKSLRDQTVELYKPYADTDKQLPTLKYTIDEIEKYATARVEYAKYIRSEGVRFIVGELDPDSDADWNRYCSDLEKLKIDELLKLQQTAYDRQYR